MDSRARITSEVNSNEESLEQKYSYVLHGAYAACEYGTRPGRLTIPVCHGTYMHDMPVMTIEDCKVGENIKVFGYCLSKDNPDIYEAMDKVLEELKKEDNLLDNIMDAPKKLFNFGKKVLSVFGVKTEKKEKSMDDYGADLINNVTVLCNPTFAIGETWSGGNERLLIHGVSALNSSCTMICTKCGGKITIIDDGQQNAINDQVAKGD